MTVLEVAQEVAQETVQGLAENMHQFIEYKTKEQL